MTNNIVVPPIRIKPDVSFDITKYMIFESVGELVKTVINPLYYGEIDGKEVAKDAKIIKFLFHPEMKNESRSLSEPSDEMEKVIDSGIRISGDIDNIKDVMYYVHNNWMGGEFSAEEAMKKISKYIS